MEIEKIVLPSGNPCQITIFGSRDEKFANFSKAKNKLACVIPTCRISNPTELVPDGKHDYVPST